MAKRTPYLWRNVFNYFIQSLKPRQIKGDLKGSDYLGNKYYEIPADPSRGKRKPSRWFENSDKESGFDREKPAEWESWLRFRRNEPPTEDEVTKNLAIAQLKKKNAALLAEKYGVTELTKNTKGMESFPKYEEYSYGDKKGS